MTDTNPLNAAIAAAIAHSNTSYVYDNIEVQKTGRTATKELKSGKTDKLFEVTPINSMNGQWKKWVRDEELFTITE